ncbi:MAG: hypothetical protein QF903_00350 [Planctomycetota bacterium]|jgi:hypothetical protein|nr:hypothetical protein [Planctomycetota bacterium]MDP6987909.1 hypothetical protein [Planctomycetota bacterium]
MMAKLGNLLLVLGTVVGALAAADSVKAYRRVDLAAAGDLSGEYLFHDVSAEDGALLGAADAPLTAELVATLVAAGVESVRVRRPARPFEPVAPGAAEGRVLFAPVRLAGRTERIGSGRILTPHLVARARAAGIDSLVLRGGAPLDLTRKPLDLPAMARLDEGIELPLEVGAGTYLDEERLAELTAEGIGTVDVKVPSSWNFADWTQRYSFLAAVLATLAGVALLRRASRADLAVPSGGDAAATAQGEDPRAVLERLVEETEALAGEVASMDATSLHAAVDALLAGPLYTLIEGRDVLRSRHGVRAAVAFMAPLAGAERQLNRAWSAAVDGAVEESRDCVGRALAPLREARAAYPPG